MVKNIRPDSHGGGGQNAVASSPQWSPDTIVSTLKTDCGPRCTRQDGVDWVVWKARVGNEIWYTTNASGNWSTPYVCGRGTSVSPAITAYNDKIYVFWASASDNSIYYTTYDGSGWSPSQGQKVPGVTTTDAPSAVSTNGNLYVGWRSKEDNTLHCSSFDGTNWNAMKNSRFLIEGGPALAIFNNNLCCATYTSDNALLLLMYANGDWAIMSSPYNATTDKGPALAYDGEQLMLMWKNVGSPYLSVSARSLNQSSWSTPSSPGSNLVTYSSPGMCGSSTGFRCVWENFNNFEIMTSTLASDQPTPPPTTSRPIPPEIESAAQGQNLIWGTADPNSYVTLTVTSALGEQLTQAQVQVDSHESWSYTLSYSLTPGMTVQAVASVDKNSTPSDAYIKVINQAQSGPLNVTGIKTDKVSGVAPDTGQIIKAWRSSDGAQMVNNKVPSTGDGKTFTFNYLSNMTLADNDLLSVVSEFKDNGTMTPFERGVVS